MTPKYLKTLQEKSVIVPA